jgi:hypothetical protein
MGDPIWLDTNTVDKALKGDAAINDQLTTLRKSGRDLLITQQVETELLYGNPLSVPKNKPAVANSPTPERRAAMKTGMDRIGIAVDEKSRSIPQATRDKYMQIKKDNISVSDRTVLTEVKASAEMRGIAKPQMLTAEIKQKAMVTQAKAFGVESVAAAVPKGPAVPNPRVNLNDYPKDEEGEISKYFKDRPFLEKLGLIGATVAAQVISNEAMSLVMDHFKDEVADGLKALNVSHPDPSQLKAQAGLEPFKRAYDQAFSQISSADALRAQEAAILAFTKDKDIPATKAYLDAQIVKVISALDGKVSDFGKIAREYIDAIGRLYAQVGRSATGLPDIAAQIQKRGDIVKSAGDELERTFWKYVPVAAGFPVLYYEWLNVDNVADSLQQVGAQVLALAQIISDRYDACTKMLDELDREMQKVSDAIIKFNA